MRDKSKKYVALISEANWATILKQKRRCTETRPREYKNVPKLNILVGEYVLTILRNFLQLISKLINFENNFLKFVATLKYFSTGSYI